MFMNSVDKDRFVKLSWELLEHKYVYYHGISHGMKPIPDHEYDSLEREYLSLAKTLNREATASQMVGFDFDRPSCQIVVSKLNKKKRNK